MLQRPWIRLVPFAIATLLGLLGVSIGFYADDLALLAFLEGRVPHGPPAWDLYRFAPNDVALATELRARGVLPWWATTEFGLHLFRPISSLLLALDHALFGRNAAPYHLHSLLWYVAVVAVVSRLHARLLSAPTARLASILFAVSAAHVMPWGWISARHLAVAAAFASAGLLCHLHWREDGARWAGIVAPALLLASLLSGESGIGGVAFVVAYELVSRRGRLAAALPACGALGVYGAVYAAVGAGARNGGGYVDPLGNPAGFLIRAAERFPLLFGNAMLGVPAELFVFGLAVPLAIVGLVGGGLIALGARRVWSRMAEEDRQALPWLLAGAAAAVVPMLGGFPGSRQLILPNLAMSAFFAAVIRAGMGARSGGRVLAWALVLLHGVLAPLAALANIEIMRAQARQIETIARTADLSGPKDRPLFAIASDPMVFLYVQAFLVLGDPPGTCWSTLSAAKGTHRIARTAPDTLVMEVEGMTFLRGPFEAIYRSEKFPHAPGDVVEQCGARFRVLDTEDGRPSRVEVQFDAPLDSDEVRILAWRDDKLVRLRIPEAGSLRVAWSPGPMGGL